MSKSKGFKAKVLSVGDEDADGNTKLKLDMGKGSTLQVSFLTNGKVKIKPGYVYTQDAKGSVNVTAK